MVNHRVSQPSFQVSSNLVRMTRIVLRSLLAGAFVIGTLAWLFPVEVVQSWALERTTGDNYRKFEAIGQAEAICWLTRFAAPVMAIVLVILLRRVSDVARFLNAAYGGWKIATKVDSGTTKMGSWRTTVMRVFCLGWVLLAVGHYGHAAKESLRNWPYYRFKSGIEVLPNISDSNRMVIRYLLESTPPNSRIFVASDQKLYFLSYYLLPRRLYYQSHPDSEFVIPQPHLRRHMAAYQLSEIDSQTIDRIAPDYILEYFEQPDSVDPSRRMEDQAWVSFFHQRNSDPHAEPAYLVNLRRYEKGGR